ncbi:unnamed protein product [marine sediment metagenome]|uniref:Uncharacterized protein n=1 Tax=marine sediment metagenome TaxID=412755 RepID=X1INZ2_9ZZZZ
MFKMKEMRVNRNATFKLGNLELIQDFMYKTKKNFSVTLNVIIEQWDEFSIAIEKARRDQETQKGLEHFDQLQKAKELAAIETKKKPIKRVRKR